MMLTTYSSRTLPKPDIITYRVAEQLPLTRKIVTPYKKPVVASTQYTPISRGKKYKSIVVTATAYGTSKKNGGSGIGRTRTGVVPVEGRTVAVDTKVIPLGTKVVLYCPSFPSINGEYIAEDTGGAIKGNRMDIYFNDLDANPDKARQRMLQFGVRKVKVYIQY
jgi:3D (Asp-Asp-Asp) domain-containing protein